MKRNNMVTNAFVLALVFIITFVALISIVAGASCEEEEQEKPALLYVMSDGLRGRIRPGKKFASVCVFDMWTPLEPTGRMSEDHLWVEIETAENDLVWCHIDYVTERREVIHVYTLWDEGVKIRQRPGYGKVTGTARKGQVLEITQVVMGYGKCSKGWVDLEYFIEDCD